MSLRILLADDSMTAQNMGKKILSDAGYEVTAVSNGAAALKKATELKPDLVILDIYMPGYTGLEVCERLKNAPDMAHIPVMLTVGKLEPYRAEDGARVRAEGVIIKPFEATDLIAAVQKIASSAVPPPPAPVVTAEPEPPVAPFIVTPPPVESPSELLAPPVLDVAPAMPAIPGFDLSSPLDAPAVSGAPLAMPAFDLNPLQDLTASPSPVRPAEEPLGFDLPDLAPLSVPEPAQMPSISLDFLRAPVPPAPPAVQEAAAPEFEPTSAPAVDLPEVELEQAFEPTQTPAETSIEILGDPALVTDPADIAAFAVHVANDESGAVQSNDIEIDMSAFDTQAGPVLDTPVWEPATAPKRDAPAPEVQPGNMKIDPVELFHEEYGPGPDGGIDLTVSERQTARPPAQSAYASAGAGFAMTPAMRDYLEMQAQQQAAAAQANAVAPQASPSVIPAPEPAREHVSPLDALLDIGAETPAPEAIPQAIKQPQVATEKSPFDDDLLSELMVQAEPDASIHAATTPVPEAVQEAAVPEPALEAAIPVPEPVTAVTEALTVVPEPVLAEEPVSCPQLAPEVVHAEAAIVEPEPAVPPAPEIAAATAPDPVPAPAIEEAVAELVPEAAPAVEPESLTQAAEAQIEPEAILAAIPEAAPEPQAEASEGLSAVDRVRIAGVVQRVFDRYKPQIIADIARELMKE